MPTLTYIDEPALYNLPKIVQGADWQWAFEMRNTDGTAIDTTGMSFACQMRDKTDAVIFTPAIAINASVVTLTLARSVTATVKNGTRLEYNIIQTDSLGKELPLIEGSVQFQKAVTR